MNNYYVIEIQTHSNGTSGNIVTGYPDRNTSEDAFMAARAAITASGVLNSWVTPPMKRRCRSAPDDEVRKEWKLQP